MLNDCFIHNAMRSKMAAPLSEQVVVSGFTVVPVKFSEASSACHYLYIKEHVVREANPHKPRERTIFVLNVPPYCTEAALRRVFSECGKVERVFLHNKPTSAVPAFKESPFFPTAEPLAGFMVAYIVFKRELSVQKAKKMSYGEPKILSTSDNPIATGLAKWCQAYRNNAPQPDRLQQDVTMYMENYDKRIAEAEKAEKEKAGMADSEGWVTVTRHGRNKGAPRTESHEKRVTIREKKKRQQKELLNFYAFQMRESKREKIAELRSKFEEDKQKIALMKMARKFKPF